MEDNLTNLVKILKDNDKEDTKDKDANPQKAKLAENQILNNEGKVIDLEDKQQ